MLFSLKLTPSTFHCQHKGGRPREEDWSCVIQLSDKSNNIIGILTVLGDGHSGTNGEKFNLADGFIQRICEFITIYNDSILSCEGGQHFIELLWCNLQTHLINKTINEHFVDNGGTTLQIQLQSLYDYIVHYHVGDSECIFIKHSGECPWDCRCVGCFVKKQLIQILGEGTFCTKTHRSQKLNEGCMPQENRYTVQFNSLSGSFSPAETNGFESNKHYNIPLDKWNKIITLLSTPQVTLIQEPGCKNWTCIQSSDGFFSHCALPNLSNPKLPPSMEDLVKLLYIDEYDFKQFFINSLNKITNQYLLDYLNITKDELNTLNNSDILDKLMKFYEHCYHNTSGIDKPWIESLRQCAQVIQSININEHTDFKSKIQWIQAATTLSFSDDNCLLLITNKFQ